MQETLRPGPSDTVTTMSDASDAFIANAPNRVRALLRSIDLAFTAYGCTSYAKTIYLGFELNQEMIAAAYPLTESVDLALALPEDHPSPLLKDATHLTWKTMPVLLRLDPNDELGAVEPLLREAFDGVAQGRHAVNRPNEHFAARRRSLQGRDA